MLFEPNTLQKFSDFLRGKHCETELETWQGECLRAIWCRLYGETLSRVEGSLAYLSYPGLANFSYISLQNLVNRLHEKQKVGSAARKIRLKSFNVFRTVLLV